MEDKAIILTTSYLPSVQYFTKLIYFDKVIIELFETYSKQSYRNRCTILSSNGPLSLSIPVVKVNGNSTKTKDVLIDYSTNWQKNHWKAIESAYNTSAYFDFIADLLSKYYFTKHKFLYELNESLISDIADFLGKDIKIEYTKDFQRNYSAEIADYRFAIHPKPQYQIEDKFFYPFEYYQVFRNKYPFIPNLSIVDLLFNEGLNSLIVLEKSIKKPA